MRRRSTAHSEIIASREIRRLFVFPSAAGRPHTGRLCAGSQVLPCSLGRSGITSDKREGDGATPRGTYRLLEVRYRPGQDAGPRTQLPRRRISPASGWCDDVQAGAYNRSVGLPFRYGHEKLWRNDRLYDVVIILDHNQKPRQKGRGSAIFFHLRREDQGPTEGCVAISAADMRRLLPRLGLHCRITIV